MSTENEGNEVPPAPSVPPAPPSSSPEEAAASSAGGAEPASSTGGAAPASSTGGADAQADGASPSVQSAHPVEPTAHAQPSAPPAPSAPSGPSHDENVTAPLPPVAAGETAQLPPVPPTGAPHQAAQPAAQPSAGHESAGFGQAPHSQPGQHSHYGQHAQHAQHAQPGHPGQPQAAGPDGGWPPQPPATPAYANGGGGQEWGASYQPAPASPKSRRGGLVAGVLAAALVAGGVGGGIGYWAAERNDSGTDSTTVSASDTPADLKREPGTVADIAAKALPSVVTIDAQGGDGEGGTGTGFVYDREGHILTNNHVVATAAQGGKLSATFSNGKKYEAEVIGRAQGYDVAVLKLKNATGLKPLALGDSDKVAVGDSTIAIGAPFGLSNTVTTGIVSAKNRPVASSDGSSAARSYMSALQTDASINPGNSGGPLLDARGAVIGINSAIQSAGSGMGGQQAGSIGLGFAIPVNQAKNVAQELIKNGKATYPMIGASVTIDETSRDGGARITEKGAGGTEPVTPGGPADKAGLKPGDLITKLDDRPIDSGPTLISEIWTHKPGDTVKLTYERDGKEHTVDVVLGSKGEAE
ncbi:trypsin-like peptidase domain-containing protein [Streptomyces sp. TRM66268-LWL]|uniref:Trypsin-like peptidase domain-containing protein n=1 Tax=Streptomyces polyasparticus TaxID=2767826 RepID=A0ABR7SIH5_9ACTN|nr:trypsin-like peptidase domain-containing protein [Streptomyces polyasparticus]MBC9714118.1 trypsin-like peptidase domain-containing protein [Streptomyces polyasparticus]